VRTGEASDEGVRVSHRPGAGTLTSTVRITVPATMRAVRLQLAATDPVGNSSTLSRTIRLR